MERVYIENDNARITMRNDLLLDVEMYHGAVFKGVQARRLFPLTGSTKYITLLDQEENEVAIIRDIETLMPDSKKAVYSALKQYYLIPKILEIKSINEKYGTIHVDAVTNHGECYFEVRDRSHNLKVLFDRRVLIKDTNDNRYEIPDLKLLDRHSLDVFLL